VDRHCRYGTGTPVCATSGGDTNENAEYDMGLTTSTSTSTTSIVSCPSTATNRPAVVSDEDKKLVTGYLFVLLEQMESCYFSEQDRTGGRSKVKNCPVGYPGFQCRHCGGKAGFGRYFPASIQALTSANSDRNIYNHLMKCRRCPETIRNDLHQLAQEQNQRNYKNRRGSRKLFFRNVWQRLHGASSAAMCHSHEADDDQIESMDGMST
jgi:hypothetical protein